MKIDKGETVKRTIKEVNEEGKWIEFWFEDDPLPGCDKREDDNGWDASSKSWRLCEAVEKAGLEEYIGRNGLNGYGGMEIVWEHDGNNWEIQKVALKGSPKLKEIQVLEKRIADALNVLDWAGEMSRDYLMKKCLVIGCILQGQVTPEELRGDGFDIDKLKTERQSIMQAMDTLAARHSEVLKELGQMKERRSDAMRIIEEKRARIIELEKKL